MPELPKDGSGDSGIQVLKIIWLAFLFGLVIYALLPPLLRLPRETPDPQFRAIVFVVLAIAAVSAIAVIFVLRRRSAAAPAGGEPEIPENHRGTMAAGLVSWALAEAVALFGVVLYLLFHEPLHLYPFLVVAFGLLLLLAPRERGSGGPPSHLARPDVKIG